MVSPASPDLGLPPVPSAASRAQGLRTAVWAVTAAFGAYFSMYLFRKPFTAATYTGLEMFGVQMKTALVSSQVLGYFLSKMMGIKFVSEMPPHRRAAAIFALVLAAEAALLLFAVVPPPWNVLCLFLNGLPLGMVFGLVVSFLEGRKATELLTAGLCASFILADGVSKSLGQWLMNEGVSLFSMPAAAGAVGLIPLSLFVWMLSRIPPPTAADEAARSHRTVMTVADRRGLCARHFVGLAAIVVAFVFTTILRSLRADFAPELWKGLGEETTPQVFATSEMWVGLMVLLICGLTVLVHDNRRAFFLSLVVCLSGFVLLLLAIAGWQTGQIRGYTTMVLFGLGLYLPYVAIHTTVFERMLAMTREKGTLAFLMTLADAAGYLGSVLVLFGKDFLAGPGDGTFLTLFQWLSGLFSIVSIVALAVAMRFFARRAPAAEAPGPLVAAGVIP